MAASSKRDPGEHSDGEKDQAHIRRPLKTPGEGQHRLIEPDPQRQQQVEHRAVLDTVERRAIGFGEFAQPRIDPFGNGGEQ